MQTRTEKLRSPLRNSTTYLAKVAVVLQEAPAKMLTFSQLMDKLAPCFPNDRKSFENNIRVCLSTNKCFVKIPIDLDSAESKRNYWKLDCSHITAKMVRRHFKGILQLFPELASKVGAENVSRASEEPCATRRAARTRRVKFTGPFSIDALLKRPRPAARTFRASPLSSLQVRAEQQLGRSPVCPTGGSAPHGLADGGATVHIDEIHACAEPLFPGAAPYFSSYITYPVPAFITVCKTLHL